MSTGPIPTDLYQGLGVLTGVKITDIPTIRRNYMNNRGIVCTRLTSSHISTEVSDILSQNSREGVLRHRPLCNGELLENTGGDRRPQEPSVVVIPSKKNSQDGIEQLVDAAASVVENAIVTSNQSNKKSKLNFILQ